MNEIVPPILYSFRRCPYAMRARLALYVSDQTCIHREVVLRDKPEEMIKISPKATVPVLEISPGHVLEQSLEIMLWALERHDPLNWLTPEVGTDDEMMVLIEQCESEFKPHLDRYKYSNRYENTDPVTHRTEAGKFLQVLEHRLIESTCLFGTSPALADFAIAPFIRQFANTDRDWFDQMPCPGVQKWLTSFLESDGFGAIMKKYDPWQPGDPPVHSATANT